MFILFPSPIEVNMSPNQLLRAPIILPLDLAIFGGRDCVDGMMG